MSRVDFTSEWAGRFWAKVERRGSEECWPWLGTVNGHGRGSFSVGGRANQRRVNATRYAYWLHNEAIRPGDVVCHHCDNPNCVNPRHLFAGTQADNLADMTRKGRRSRFALRGEAAPGCKISDADAAKALARVKAGESPTAVAAEIGVHRATIYKLARRLAR